MRRRKRSFSRRSAKWVGWILVGLLLLTLAEVAALRFVDPPFTAETAWHRLAGSGAGGRSMNAWQSLGAISPHLRRAVLAGEDQRFLSHHGFDFTEMNQAIKDMALNKRVRGASTITMQVARTVFLWSSRSWLRKLLEAYYTVLIELFWSKERILEVYLNTVDWGTGIMGAEAASKAYFHISARDLSRSQAALLAAVLPNPHEWSPVRPGPYVVHRKNRILADMNRMPLLASSKVT